MCLSTQVAILMCLNNKKGHLKLKTFSLIIMFNEMDTVVYCWYHIYKFRLTLQFVKGINQALLDWIWDSSLKLNITSRQPADVL